MILRFKLYHGPRWWCFWVERKRSFLSARDRALVRRGWRRVFRKSWTCGACMHSSCLKKREAILPVKEQASCVANATQCVTSTTCMLFWFLNRRCTVGYGFVTNTRSVSNYNSFFLFKQESGCTRPVSNYANCLSRCWCLNWTPTHAACVFEKKMNYGIGCPCTLRCL